MPKQNCDEFFRGIQNTRPRKTLSHLAYPQTFPACDELGLLSWIGRLGRLDCLQGTFLALVYRLRSAWLASLILAEAAHLALVGFCV
jgi:hypothetical protein